MTSTPLNTRGVRVESGKYSGKLFTRVPVRYLRWMVANGTGQSEYAEAELKRRGSILPTVKMTGHAINRASLDLWRKFWRGKDNIIRGRPREGLKSWLVRISEDALAKGTKKEDNSPDSTTYYYRGLQFVFELNRAMPVLKTIMPRTGRGKKPRLREEPRK